MSTIVKWAPFTTTELGSMERRMRRLLEGASGFAAAPLPAADVYETGGEYVVELEVPGYEEEELAVEVARPYAGDQGPAGDEEGGERKGVQPPGAPRPRLRAALRSPGRGRHPACEGDLRQGRARSPRTEGRESRAEAGHDYARMTGPHSRGERQHLPLPPLWTKGSDAC